jgi:hypothetical protein
MESDSVAVSEKPRPWLLAMLGVAVVALVAFWLWPAPSATSGLEASNQARATQRRAQEQTEPSDLDVRLESLSAPTPREGAVERNLFRFRPKPVPGPARDTTSTVTRTEAPPPVLNGPVAPPPIPLKFIGIVEKQGMKVAALSDCRSTFYGVEGQIIDGRYRLVRIGVESITIEYVDGAGNTTVRLDGCPAR